MKVAELIRNVYFHDSSILHVTRDERAREVRVEIELCNWMQAGYTSEQPEIVVGILTLQHVQKFRMQPELELSADGHEILTTEVTPSVHGDYETLTFVARGGEGVIVFEITCQSVSFHFQNM
ncbi:hypothetical protein OS242_04445 [Tumebacillus sp. DT12]|uniref:Uncharacterized protein n=1 Tax=Tumebacillus lacus TaxID=2995335 RepID=A0ABT3X0X1_9BACL|nr:hypothetical protein [Tumebacillus lacus]MCX7569200.1 hypothetical protein [Tumebacillus lacus]